MKPEYLMLAQTFDPDKNTVGGWYWSEKLDGTRVFWDGGISRFLPSKDIPYANTIKDDRYVDEQYATGLWSRSGKVIHAPDWWVEQLPNIPLDGELWMGYGRFQELRSVVADLNNPNWHDVKFMVFDSPTSFFTPRKIKIRNEYEFNIKDGVRAWALDHGLHSLPENWHFELTYIALQKRIREQNNIKLVEQHRLPLRSEDALEKATECLNGVLDKGGEGLVFRKITSQWTPERSHFLLKYKPWFTDEGTIIGYTSGEEGKTGQLLGMVGALILNYNGKILKLSGLTHEQREIRGIDFIGYATARPGKQLPDDFNHHIFPIGTRIEFKYRELSNDGIPKEARFHRIRNDE